MNERDYKVVRLDGGHPGIWISAQEARFLAQIVAQAGGDQHTLALTEKLRSCWVDDDKVEAVPLYVEKR